MKIKNISKGDFRLQSGPLKPGEEGEANFAECKVLFSSKKAIVVIDPEDVPKKVVKPAIKKVVKPKASSNG